MTPLQHLQLLLRFDRTNSLLRIIREVVAADQNVLDAGCGLGVLAQCAAQQGARVTAVDLDDVSLGRQLAQENHLGDRIDFHQANLDDLLLQKPELKKSFDVIIAMIYLNDPRRDENQSQLAARLKDQFLKPGGITIPTHLEYQASIGHWPGQDLSQRLHTIEERVSSIRDQYGLKFESLQQQIQTTAYKEFFPQRMADGSIIKKGYRQLGGATERFTVDYRNGNTDYPSRIQFRIVDEGVSHVVLWTQRIMFDDKLIFSNESISWIQNPTAVLPNQVVFANLDSHWRSQNQLQIKISRT